MQRRNFIKLTGAAAGVLAATEFDALKLPGQSIKRRPNILWISCEDINPRLGCYGDTVADTPNLDRLAARGMRFDRAFTSSPVCAPVRSGIITGMYPTTIGTHNMRTSHKGEDLPTPYLTCPPPYVKAFTEYLRAAGYYCTNNAKTDYQFADFSDTPITIWDECSREAHYRHRPDANQPFFAVFNFETTHESQTWAEPEFTDPIKVEVPPYYPDTPRVRRAIAREYDQIHKMDQQAGAVLDELETLGLAENTIVFFWGDHGDGLPRHKRWLYDSGTHIPLIVRWPGHLKAGSVNDQLINSIDFGPAVLSLAGVDIPAYMQGRSFLGNQAGSPQDYLFSHRDRFDESYDMIRSVRDKKYRYIRNYYTNQPYVQWIPYRNNHPIMQEMLRLEAEDKLEGPQKLWFRNIRPAEELYDCDADPYNIDNLADDPEYAEILKRLSGVLDAWREETDDLGDTPESELKERWWPGGIQPVTARVRLIPNAESNRGQKPVSEEAAAFNFPAMISFYCPTQGASMAYTTETGKQARWKIVSGPVRLPRGTTLIRARAIRYGYKESEETKCLISVQ